MVNVFVFTDSATTSAGWLEVAAGYRERMVLGGGTALETGGADVHTHSGNVSVNSANTDVKPEGYYAGPTVAMYNSATSHTHSGSVYRVDNCTTHLPPYKTFRMLYRSTTGWTGDLPSSAIAFCESVPATFARFDSGSSYYIRISATAGSTGGATTHYHYCEVSFGNWSSGSNTQPAGTDFGVVYPTHAHYAVGINSGAATHDYAYWACGLVKSSTATRVKKDCILLFDGDPGAGWSSVTATNRFLRVSATNSITTGGTYLTHSHTHSLSGNSGTANSCYTARSTTYNLYGWSCGHTHSFSGSLNSGDALPTYVRLLLYRATKNFGGTSPKIFVFC
jgi:hypothetical protein